MFSKSTASVAVIAVLGSGGHQPDPPPAEGPIQFGGGTFRMGTPSSAVPALKQRFGVNVPGVFDNEVPEHTVTISGFQFDRAEVTNARFAAFVTARPEWRRDRLPSSLQNGRYLDGWTDGSLPADRAEHPVVFVTWHAAQAFCRWAGGRLPTEAEWGFAARNGQTVEFPWGDWPPTPQQANYSASAQNGTAPVKSYPPASSGLYDLSGNVWELLLDAWQPDYPGEAQLDPIAGGPIADERLLAVSGRRAIRGGSFGAAAVNLRTRWRDSHPVTNAVAFVGFRCAYPVPGRSPQ